MFNPGFIKAEEGNSRGSKITALDGTPLKDYKKSVALIIGASDYQTGWNNLPSVPQEMERVERALKRVGFETVLVENPTEDQLRKQMESFVDQYGFDKDNRLLFFFSGHGHSDQEGRGYIVPVDAPNPRLNSQGFYAKAIDMVDIRSLALKIKSRHALFMFDSCFSGTIFQTRSAQTVPYYIKRNDEQPVRQFITAGSANEEVPARSEFVQAFINAISGSAGNFGDGYITGGELGQYIYEQVARPGLTPQYGKLNVNRYKGGNFIFKLPISTLPPSNAINRVANPELLPRSEQELAQWDAIRACDNLLAMQKFIKDYPNSSRIGSAQSCIAELLRTQPIKMRIETVPFNARVELINTGELYNYGKEYKPGLYKIKVSANGYKSKTVSFTLSHTKKEKEIVLTEPGDMTYIVGDTSFTLKAIPGGTFKMGCSEGDKDCDKDEFPVHEVTIPTFRIMETEVTWNLYQQCNIAKACPDSPKDYGWGKGERPIIVVSWNDVNLHFIPWLSQQTGATFRLPSESEWEYAARAGTTSPYYWGETASHEYANYSDVEGNDKWEYTSPVKSFPPNEFGLYDMSGNVWEWTADCYKDSYNNAPVNGTAVELESCKYRVVRGGSWFDNPATLRSSNRAWSGPTNRGGDVGFRLAQDIQRP